jgi:hypothetical protein
MREQALVSRRVFSLASDSRCRYPSRQLAKARVFAQGSPPAVLVPDAKRPAIPYGVVSGDVTNSAAIK